MIDKHKLYIKHKLFPLKASIIYVTVTFILSIVGPVNYLNDIYNYWIVIPFLLCVVLCLLLGYRIGCMSKVKRGDYNEATVLNKERKMLYLSLILSIFSLGLELIYLVDIGHFSLSVSNIGNMYISKIESHANIIIFIRFICSIFRFVAISLGFYKFHKLPFNVKTLIIINSLLYILVFVFGYGIQKGVSDIVICFVLVVYISKMKQNKLSKMSFLPIIVVLAGAFVMFSYMQYLRYVPRGINASNFHLYSTGEYYFDTSHPVFLIFGDALGFGMAVLLMGYLTQGYYGLSLCMQIPFEWSYGIGNSFALTSLLKKIGGENIFERTYLSRLTDFFPRDGLRSWNTIFPWLASDFTWIGAALVFVFVGYFMAKTWKEIILKENIISYMFFCKIVILIIFIPANNQLFHGYDAFISTWLLIFIWLFLRRKYMHE